MCTTATVVEDEFLACNSRNGKFHEQALLSALARRRHRDKFIALQDQMLIFWIADIAMTRFLQEMPVSNHPIRKRWQHLRK